MHTIYFDMDGTIADLYGYEGWLDMLHNEDTTPYEDCEVITNVEELRETFDALLLAGFTLGVISWGAMGGSREYCKRTRKAKKEWCEKYFPQVFTEFHVVKYGTPKHQVRNVKDSILVDDNADVRNAWKGETIDASDTQKMIESLLNLAKSAYPPSHGWKRNFYKECEHTMSPMFKEKLSSQWFDGGLYLLGQTTFNPHTYEKYYWIKVGMTNNPNSRFKAYRTSSPTIYYVDWLENAQQKEGRYHSILTKIAKGFHRFEWYLVTEEAYLKICEKGFAHFPI